jgi:hypothetical protein
MDLHCPHCDGEITVGLVTNVYAQAVSVQAVFPLQGQSCAHGDEPAGECSEFVD